MENGGKRVEIMENYKFVQNSKCEYFPCHKGAEASQFNCLFCYCPLYALGDKCGGNFTYTEDGIKDCSNCLIPHRRENYEIIMGKMGKVIDLTKRKD